MKETIDGVKSEFLVEVFEKYNIQRNEFEECLNEWIKENDVLDIVNVSYLEKDTDSFLITVFYRRRDISKLTASDYEDYSKGSKTWYKCPICNYKIGLIDHGEKKCCEECHLLIQCWGNSMQCIRLGDQ